jgi:hypothetical protein
MISSVASEPVTSVSGRPAQFQAALPVLGVNAGRLDNLRRLLLQRDLVEQSREQSWLEPPVILGQWRN